MTRLARSVFEVLAMLSLALLMALAAIWVRSYQRADVFTFVGVNGRGEIVSSNGGFRYIRSWTAPESLSELRKYYVVEPPTALEFAMDTAPGILYAINLPSLNIFFSRSTTFDRYHVLDLISPYWIPSILAAFLPAVWLMRIPAQMRRKRRVREGLCVKCGYDLRANKERCPECGEKFKR